MNVETFLNNIQKNADRTSSYRAGGDGSDGTCDCIGQIIGAIRLAGEKWDGLHGSNWTARNKMASFDMISKTSTLNAGEQVFKSREKNSAYWTLPERYANDSDQRDYYHVGIVMQVNPLRIKHCTTTSGGIQTDMTIGQWAWHGKMKGIDYTDTIGKETIDMSNMIYGAITAETGNTVNQRTEKSISARVIKIVPVGKKVKCYNWDAGQEWTKVEYEDATGYMMTRFIIPVGEDSQKVNAEDSSEKLVQISMPRTRTEELLAYIQKALNE